MSATFNQHTEELLKARMPGVQVSDKMPADAKYVVERIIISGAGALIVDHILPKGLGVHIEFKVESGTA